MAEKKPDLLKVAKAVEDKITNPLVAIERILKGQDVPKTYLEIAKADLEYLNYMVKAIKEQTGNVRNNQDDITQNDQKES